MRLLFAEDERDLNRILTKKLTEEGYSVDSCYDGVEAMDYLTAIHYDGVILDVMMPKADGFAVLENMRKQGIDTPVRRERLPREAVLHGRTDGAGPGSHTPLL